MAYSLAQTYHLICPQCGHDFSASIWLILDADEHPDLLARVAQGNLHRLSCPQCGTAITVDAPLLLVHRHGPQTRLIFSPAESTTREQDQEHLNDLIAALKAALGADWPVDWPETPQIVPQVFLPLALGSATPEVLQELQERLLDALLPEMREAMRLIQESDETIRSEEDLRNLLERRPDLLQRLEKALRILQRAAEEAEPPAPSAQTPSSTPDPAAREPQEPNPSVKRLLAEAGALGQTLVDCLQVRSPEEHRAFLQAHPELLTDAGLSWLERLLEWEKHSQMAPGLRFFLQVHRRAREVGVETAFAELQAGEDELVQRFQRILALQEETENRPTLWRGVLTEWQALIAEADQKGKSRLAALARRNLANMYRQLYEMTGNPQWADAAQALFETISQFFTPEEHPQEWATTQHNLGSLFLSRFERSGDDAHAQRAEQHFRSILEHHAHHILPIDLPFRSSAGLSYLAARRCRWEDCLKYFESGRSFLQHLLGAQTHRSSKEDWLGEVGGVYQAAAYAAWRKGDLRHVVEILEEGRAQVLRESLERRRADLKALQGTPYHRYYEDYTQALDRVEALIQIAPIDYPASWAAQYSQALERRNAAEEALRQYVPGFEHFLRPLSYAAIQEQAVEAPLVYLADTPHGGLACIVYGKNGLHLQEFPALTTANLAERVNAHLTAYFAWRSAPAADARRTAWMKALDDTTHWLGETLMMPLSDALASLGWPPAGWVQLIPGGALTLLPLHAAWVSDSRYPTGRRYALDDYTFTYLPNAHTRYQMQRHAASARPAVSLLVIENPHPEDANALHFSEEAVVRAMEVFEGHYHHLQGKDATLAAVKSLLPAHAVLYFFTHGQADFNAPARSGLMLAGEDWLTLEDLYGLDLSQVRLAILAACESGVPTNLRALNEAVSLPIGWLTAGVPGVVGSLWAVNELSTALLMTLFFDIWRDPAHPVPPWEALRRAQQTLRDESAAGHLKKRFISEFTAQPLLPEDLARRFFDAAAIQDLSHPYFWAGFAYYGL
ncbi:CHAT domain-containing protein [uncultured Thermanaerothrix sp.]|uniref:CHAT domain-containing protein n=1 Tax=uncultured Thermanaerothrix sp. TaxID=1195149 RepID=UPI00262D5903|nr:CHAT domain-containing protein [uncultured Thermanaerothrix sp.]